MSEEITKVEQTRYRHIHFEVIEEKAKAKVWECRNNKTGARLGEISWYGPWRKYCICLWVGCVFDDGCLDDISHFLKQLRR